MTRKFHFLASFGLATLLITSPNLSGAQTQQNVPNHDVIKFMGTVRTDSEFFSARRQAAIKMFEALDTDGGGYGPSDDNLTNQITEARQRGVKVGKWAANDLNGDGVASRTELELVFGPKSRENLRVNGLVLKPSDEQVREILDRWVAYALRWDYDGNDVVSLYEIINGSRAEYIERVENTVTTPRPFIFGFDANKDGTVEREEFEKVLDDFINWYDVNGNGVADTSEKKMYTDARQNANRAVHEDIVRARGERERAAEPNVCGRLDVPENATTIVIGGYEGKAVSSVHVGGAQNVTRVIDVKIRLGFGSVFLMLDTYDSVIWRISGETHRVVGVGIDGTAAGVVGIPVENVQYFNSRPCELNLWKRANNSSVDDEMKLLAVVLGEQPDVFINGYELGLVNIPNGVSTFEYKYPGVLPKLTSVAGRKVEADFLRFNPGGVVSIDPATVVSNASVEPYALLPQEAGLARLAEAGAIEPAGIWLSTPIQGLRMGREGIEMSTGDGKSFRSQGGDDLILYGGKEYRIVGGSIERSFMGERNYILRERINIPVGLGGAHSVTFLLPDDVPPPRGDIAGSELKALEE